MATRHELIHIDFVANAGKANPVLKSLQVSCNDARIAKEQLDAKLKDAKAMNAPAEVITDLEKKLKSQTTTWQQLERGLREYTKGIDTLSKGIKEFNDGTLDDMSAKFNKAVYNSAKLAQSAVKTGSSDWNQLQRLMDATDRNVTRAREDIDLMMQSLRDGSAVSTVQLTRSRDVLEDLARLAVTNSEEWRGLRKQFNEVDAAITSVTETEKRLKGEIATEADAIALSNHLTKESIALRHADGEAAMMAAQESRKGVEETMRGISDRIVLRTKERDAIKDEIEIQENLDNIIKERDKEILSAQNRKQEAEQRKAQAQATIREYDEQEKKVQELKLQKKDLEEQQKKETREAEKSAKATEEQNKKQAELTQTVSTLKGEIGGLETSLHGLEEQIKKTSAEPIKPKVDTSKIEELQAKLKAVQDGIVEKNAQIEAESKGGSVGRWQEILTRVKGSKDGRLNPMGLGDDKKQMDDMLDVANNFYEIIKKVKGVTEDKFIPAQAAEPIKQLAEYYKITDERARELVKTLQRSEVVTKKFGTFDYNEMTGFLAINKNKGKDDQQIRIEAAQSYMNAASRNEANQTEKVNKLLADKKKLEEEEVEIKGKLQAATEGVAEATVKSGEATERRVNLTKKEKEEVKKLTDENNSLTGTIDALKKQLDSLSVSQGKATASIKDGAEAAKGEAEAMKMTAEEAKAALAKMTEKSTFKFQGDKIVASNLEEAENSLISIVSKSGDYKAVLRAFQEKYQIKEKDQARDIIKQLAAGGKGGLIESGFEREGEFFFTLNEEKRAARINTMKELLTLSKGVTIATQAQTKADEAQAAELERLNQVWKEKEKLYQQSNSRYLALMGKVNSMEGPTEYNGQLTKKGEKLRDAEEYRKERVAKVRKDANEAKQAYDDYAKAILDGTAATEANTKTQKDNVDIEKQRKQISEQILTLEQQKAANTERLTQLQEKGTKATKEQVKADGEAVTTGKNMNELLQEKERITARLTEKQAKLKKAQEELAKMTKEETTAGKEQSSVTEELTKKTEEYNAETEKLANMKEGRNKARGVVRNADRSISNADDAIATLKNEALPQRKTEAEMGAMKKRVADLTAEVEKETAAFNKNAQAITELNKKETDAAIEMAQSENVSIEKVKQSIELLQKKIQTEATDADTMKQRGEAINRLTERLTQMNAEVVKLSKPIADRLNTKNLGTLNETELQQSIDAAKQLLKTYKTGSDEANQLAANIVRAEQYMDSVGIKAAKKAAQQAEEIKQERELHRLMNARLKDLSTLSADAMAETKKYWEAQRNGAEAGSYAFKKAEKSLKAIGEEQERQQRKQLEKSANRLQRKDLSVYSEQDLTGYIKDAEKLASSMKPADKGYQTLIDNIVRAKKHVKEFGLEGEQSSRKVAEQLQQMNDRMGKLSLLSDGALEETRKFWQAQRDGAERGSEAYKQAEQNMKAVAEQQARLVNKQNETQARQLLKKGNLDSMSEGDIRKSIEAAKAYQQTLSSSDKMYQRLSVAIVDAEEHIKQYGLESERSARKEAEAQRLLDEKHRMMQERMQNLKNLSEGGLEETRKYWQAQMDGAERSSRAFKEAEKNLKAISAEQERLSTEQLKKQARRLNTKDLSTMTEQEVTESVKAAKQLALTTKPTEDGYKQLQDNIIRAEQHVKDFGLEAERSMKKAEEQTKLMNQRMKNISTLSADALEETRKYWEAQRNGAEAGSKAFEKAEANLKRIDNLTLKRKRENLDNILGNPEKYGIEEVRNAVKEMEQLRDSVQQGVPAWQHYNKMVEQGKKYLAEWKDMAAAGHVEKQMQQLNTLSKEGLAEVKKYWQAQYDGAERGSQAYKDAEAALKRINDLESTRKAGQATRVLFKPENYGDAEIREAIQAMEQLRDAQAHGSAQWELYNKRVEEGRRYLDEWKQTDSVVKFEGQMAKLPQLSDAALQETKKFWETMVAGAEKGSSELAQYEAHLEKVKQEERERRQMNDEITVQRLDGNLKNQSEQEISEAIEAGKRLIKTYETASPEADALAKKIADAEEHLKKYGLEAERTARKEAQAVADAAKKRQESDDLMKQQLQQGASLSKEALKAQEQYWKHLIDDPKTAASSLADYQQQLDKVRLLQQMMMQQEGADALDFFKNGDYENASADEIKRQSDALKKYRDSLPQQDEADTIQEINELLIKAGVAAQKAAGETMTFKQALRIGMDAKGGNFKGTVEQLTQAKKTLEQLQQTAVKGGLAWRRMQDGIDSINLELKRTSYLSKEVQDILDKPKGRSLNALKQAVEQGRAALQNMDRTTKDGQKAFDELAKKIKATELELKQMSGEAKASVSAFEKAWSRLKTYVGLYVGASVAMNKLMGTIGDIHELSDKMGEVRKTTGFTADEVGRLSTNLKQLDTRTGLTSLMETAAKAGQLGLKSLEDVQGFTQAANMLMVALPEMGQEAATEMLKVALATGEVKKIQDQINKGLIEGSSATEVAMTKIGSTIDQLRANSAAAAPQITDFVKRVGAVGAQSGITIDQVAALGATVDALGMRVEMSATALSRMIPAIKNNAFELAKAIGVTPETVRNLFDTGRGMEVILMIFDRIKESGMDADSIENMLGMAGMKDIMKDLNQQGARAGIVFAGLSQNVDELRRNLRTAGEAYEENIAILSEYNKMNDTTAAKWERLKNQVEELFVGDTAQRWFGYIITGMRWIVDLLTSGNGISAGLRIIIVYLGLVKANIGGILVGIRNCGGGLKGIAMWLGIIDKQTKKIAWGNIFTALAMAILYAWHELSNLKTALEKANEALGKTKEEVGRAQERFEGYYQKLKSTSEALQQARISHDKLSAEVDKLRQSTDKSATATANLKKKEDELKKSEDKVTQASRDHKSAISDMNSIYGKYLGFILTEANYSNLAAAAHDKVTAAIEREMLMKQRQAAIGDVDSQYAQDIATGYGKLNERLVSYGKLERREASQAMSDLQKFLRDNVKYDSGSNQSVVSKAVTDQLKREGLDLSKATADEVVALWYDKYLKENYHISDNVRRGITGVERRNDVDKRWGTVYTPFSTNLRGGYASTYVQREQQRGAVSTVYDTDITRSEGEEAKAAGTLLSKLEQQAKQAKKSILDKNTNDKDRNMAYGELANALEGLENRINELNPQQDAETINRLRDMAKSLSSSGIDVNKLKKAREEIHATLFERATFNEDTIKNLDTTNPWGSALEAESTDWKNMTAEQLVNRRKQMKDFVNAIQTDTDVQSVLKEDAALKKAIENGMSSDMRTVIEWYNTERLKIQDELHARHLTNTGDWMDPKKERGAKKQFRDEMDAYLHELDAYYTERKTRIEEAGTDEGLTEAEIRNRTLNNEMEWQQRRAELQKLYSRKQKEVTQEELDAIYHIIAERTGDSESFVKAQIAKTNQFVDSIEKSGEKGAAIVHRWMSQVELDTERSYLKGQQALTKQMRAIEAIIDKERPFNGITKSLQESLSTMDVLTGEMRKEYNELMKQGKDMTDFNNRQAQEEMKRTAFLLGEAENAYSTTIDNVMDDMRQKGMTAWADWLSADPKLQEALMAQLRSTYDAIQDAIKKEASQLKKQAEIMWNNILMPDGKTTLKQTADRAVAQLGLDEGRVKRANSLIGAGQASERVADKLAIQQMKVQLAMQEHYYNLMRKRGQATVDMLEAQAKAAKERGDEEKATSKTLEAQHARMSLNLATAKEETELAKQREDIIARTEESQNRLYTELKSWADLLSSSMQSLFEASHAGDAEYYNERAKLDLTGKGGPGAGTYVVIDNEGTSDAKAHYEYLDERQALERQREIENDNAVAEAWKKVWDDLNQKMSDTITDLLNAMLQNAAIYDNTDATLLNTEALAGLTSALEGGSNGIAAYGTGGTGGAGGADGAGGAVVQNEALSPAEVQEWTDALGTEPWLVWEQAGVSAMQNVQKATADTGKKMQQSTQSTFAKMTAAANMYGIAYQTMSNENLDASQKFQMFALQAAGQAAIGMLTTDMFTQQGKNAVQMPGILGKLLGEMPYPAAMAAFALVTALMGGLMGMMVSKVSKSKSQIAQVTGASASAGKLTTGMLTYAEGNVNEFTDPATLTVGRRYNVDGADGRTYKARYMGTDPKTHLTNGPEFHLVGEAGREAIIDAHTTRNIQMNEPEIWRSIQTLYNGGRISSGRTRRGGGLAAFADGNIGEFGTGGYDIATYGTDGTDGTGAAGIDIAAMTEAMNRQAAVQEALLERLSKPIVAQNIWTGPDGIPNMYNKMQKEAKRHGVKYL